MSTTTATARPFFSADADDDADMLIGCDMDAFDRSPRCLRHRCQRRRRTMTSSSSSSVAVAVALVCAPFLARHSLTTSHHRSSSSSSSMLLAYAFIVAPPPPSTRAPTSAARHRRKTTAHAPLMAAAASLSSDDDDDQERPDEPTTATFASLGLSPTLSNAAYNLGWTTPTPVQCLSIPAILGETPSSTSSSVWCEAPTGSGKTGGYALPLVQLLLDVKNKRGNNDEGGGVGGGGGGGVKVLVLCPTRELAVQIGGVFGDVLESIPAPSSSSSSSSFKSSGEEEEEALDVVVVTGGVPIEPQIEKLASTIRAGKKLDVLVATPGRLVDVLLRHSGHSKQGGAKRGGGAQGSVVAGVVDSGGNMVDNDYEDENENTVDPIESALERRLLDALDATGKTDATLTLSQITESKLDRVDDDGRSKLSGLLRNVEYVVLDEADRLVSSAFRKETEEVINLIMPSEEGKEGTGAEGGAKVTRSRGSSRSARRRSPRLSSSLRRDSDYFYGDDSANNEEEAKPTKATTRRSKQLTTMLFSATFPEQIEEQCDRILRRLSRGEQEGGEKSRPPPLRLSCSGTAGATSYINDGYYVDDATMGDAQHEEEGEEEHLSHRQRKRLARTTRPTSILTGPMPHIDLRTIRVNERDRTQALRYLLERNDHAVDEDEWDRVLVFVSTRYASEHVSRKLRRANIRSAELHGKLNQDARTRRLEDFRKGKVRVLIATDLASRGLDVVGLPAVVNYDLPRSTADFTHRIGRTGRAGRRGTAVTFVTPNNESHYDLIERRHLHGRSVEREVLPGFEPNESNWALKSVASRTGVPDAKHSSRGLVHDKMHGGVKGRRKSKKDKLREAAAKEAVAKAKAERREMESA